MIFKGIPFEDAAFDIVYARHILEHLPYYEKALEELIRVARYEALVVFFIPATDVEDIIDFGISDGHMVYHNRYNRAKLEKFVLSQPKVSHITWETISQNEEILHIFVTI